MTSRSWLLVAGFLAVVGLAVVEWQDSISLAYKLSSKLIKAESPRLAPSDYPTELGSLTEPSRLAPVADVQQSPTRQAMSNPLSSLKRGDFASIPERPLFSPSRRPPQIKRVVKKPAVSRPKPAPVRPALQLSVVGAITHTSKRIVVFKDQRTGRHISARTGSNIRGWRVVDIQPSSVLLSKDRWKVRLDIFVR